MPKSPFVTKIDAKMSDLIQRDLEEMGFTLSKKPYMRFCAQKKGVAVHSYESGKLVVQGSLIGEFMEFYLEPKLGDFSFTNPNVNIDKTERIGGDESGKGDFFGPLCVAAVFADRAAIEALAEQGVRDSKTLTDKKIGNLCEKIRSLCTVETLALFPAKYNELYAKFGNLNRLLAWAHSACVHNLAQKKSSPMIIIDQFESSGATKRAFAQKGLPEPTLRVRAESDIVVASASIIARGLFVDGMHKLSNRAGFELPKGGSANATAAAKKIAGELGKEALSDFVKLHFKNADAIN